MTPRKTQPAPRLTGLPQEAADEVRNLAQVVYRLSSRLDLYDAGIPQTQVRGLVEELASKVPQTRRIMTQTPLGGGRDLKADMTLTDSGGGGGGGGITTINPGVNIGPTVTFQTGTAGANFALTTPAANTIEIDLPVADATHTGKLTNTDWAIFNAKVAASGTLTLNQPIFGGGTNVVSAGTKRGNTNVGQMADNTTSPTTGHLAAFDANGNITDGGAPPTPPIVVAFYINNGSAGDPVAADFAPRAGSLTKCKVLVVASDAAVDLTFDIKKNGVTVFTAPPTVAMGTASLTLVNETASLTGTIAVAADDIFKLSISSGSSSWIVSIKLET